MPDSDPARKVRLGIKTGAFYGQEGVSEAIPPEGAFWDQEADG